MILTFFYGFCFPVKLEEVSMFVETYCSFTLA